MGSSRAVRLAESVSSSPKFELVSALDCVNCVRPAARGRARGKVKQGAAVCGRAAAAEAEKRPAAEAALRSGRRGAKEEPKGPKRSPKEAEKEAEKGSFRLVGGHFVGWRDEPTRQALVACTCAQSKGRPKVTTLPLGHWSVFVSDEAPLAPLLLPAWLLGGQMEQVGQVALARRRLSRAHRAHSATFRRPKQQEKQQKARQLRRMTDEAAAANKAKDAPPASLTGERGARPTANRPQPLLVCNCSSSSA